MFIWGECKIFFAMGGAAANRSLAMEEGAVMGIIPVADLPHLCDSGSSAFQCRGYLRAVAPCTIFHCCGTGIETLDVESRPMRSSLRWKVVTVKGHDLESRLQELTDEGHEIFGVHPSAAGWTIIAHTTGDKAADGKSIGFQPPQRESREA